MSKSMRKLTAFVIALAFLITMLPALAVSAAAGDYEVMFVYDGPMYPGVTHDLEVRIVNKVAADLVVNGIYVAANFESDIFDVAQDAVTMESDFDGWAFENNAANAISFVVMEQTFPGTGFTIPGTDSNEGEPTTTTIATVEVTVKQTATVGASSFTVAPIDGLEGSHFAEGEGSEKVLATFATPDAENGINSFTIAEPALSVYRAFTAPIADVPLTDADFIPVFKSDFVPTIEVPYGLPGDWTIEDTSYTIAGVTANWDGVAALTGDGLHEMTITADPTVGATLTADVKFKLDAVVPTATLALSQTQTVTEISPFLVTLNLTTTAVTGIDNADIVVAYDATRVTFDELDASTTNWQADGLAVAGEVKLTHIVGDDPIENPNLISSAAPANIILKFNSLGITDPVQETAEIYIDTISLQDYAAMWEDDPLDFGTITNSSDDAAPLVITITKGDETPPLISDIVHAPTLIARPWVSGQDTDIRTITAKVVEATSGLETGSPEYKLFTQSTLDNTQEALATAWGDGTGAQSMTDMTNDVFKAEISTECYWLIIRAEDTEANVAYARVAVNVDETVPTFADVTINAADIGTSGSYKKNTDPIEVAFDATDSGGSTLVGVYYLLGEQTAVDFVLDGEVITGTDAPEPISTGGDFTIPDDETCDKITFAAIDGAGNVTIVVKDIYIDNQDISVNPTAISSWTSAVTKGVTFKVGIDNLEGTPTVADTKWALGEQTIEYMRTAPANTPAIGGDNTGGFTFDVPADPDTIVTDITIYAKASTGADSIQTLDVMIDRVKPVFESPVVAQTPEDSGTYEGMVLVTVEISDAGSGLVIAPVEDAFIIKAGGTEKTVADLTYTPDTAEAGMATTGTLSFYVDENNANYTVTVMDDAGNESISDGFAVTTVPEDAVTPITLLGTSLSSAVTDIADMGELIPKATFDAKASAKGTKAETNGTFTAVRLGYADADADGKTVTIEYSATGNPGAIDAPYTVSDTVTDGMVGPVLNAPGEYTVTVTTDGAEGAPAVYEFEIVETAAEVKTIDDDAIWTLTDVMRLVRGTSNEDHIYDYFQGGYYSGDVDGDFNYGGSLDYAIIREALLKRISPYTSFPYYNPAP